MPVFKAAIVAAALVVGGCAASAGIASADPTGPLPGPPPGPPPQTTIDHDGTYAVGTDIAAGTYSSPGPVTGGACYWKRLGSDKALIDSALSLKPQVVEIDPTDKAFKTDGCQPWQKTDSVSPDATPPPASAAAQLRTYVDNLNAGARQFGAGQVPGP